jgi:pyrrolidone-carboxylate peptidase
MHYTSTKKLDVPAGFIHVPKLPKRVLETREPHTALSLIVRRLEIIVKNVSGDL